MSGKKETPAEKEEREREEKIFKYVGVDPNAPIDSQDIDKYIQEKAQQQEQERQRIQVVQRQAILANLKPGNEGRYTVDAQGIIYDRGRRKNGGKIRRKTRRRTRKSKKSKKSRRHRK